MPSRASRSITGASACQSRSRLQPSTTITYTRRASWRRRTPRRVVARLALRIRRQPLRERRARPARRVPAAIATAAAARASDAGGRLLRQQRRGAQRDQQLRDLLERVPARGVGVREDEPPEAQAVRPRRAGSQVVVDGAPDDDREERVAGERAGQQRRRAPRLEQRHRGERGEPQQGASAQREGEAGEHRATAAAASSAEPERPVRRQADAAAAEQHEQRIHDRERPPLVEDVPGTGRPDLGEATRWSAAGHSRHRIRVP